MGTSPAGPSAGQLGAENLAGVLLVDVVRRLLGIRRPDDLQADDVDALPEQPGRDGEIRQMALGAGGTFGQRLARRDMLAVDFLAVDVDDQPAAVADGERQSADRGRVGDRELAAQADPGQHGRLAGQGHRPAVPEAVVEIGTASNPRAGPGVFWFSQAYFSLTLSPEASTGGSIVQWNRQIP